MGDDTPAVPRVWWSANLNTLLRGYEAFAGDPTIVVYLNQGGELAGELPTDALELRPVSSDTVRPDDEPAPWREPDHGPDAGHTWRIEVTSRSSCSVVDDPEHHDAERFDGYLMRTSVRAWSLKAALTVAGGRPLTEWLPMEDDDAAAAVVPSPDSEAEPARVPCPDCGDDPEDPESHADGCPRIGTDVRYQCGPPWEPLPGEVETPDGD